MQPYPDVDMEKPHFLNLLTVFNQSWLHHQHPFNLTVYLLKRPDQFFFVFLVMQWFCGGHETQVKQIRSI